ncbi:hypothetical protein AB0C74_31150 [Spirillospora sp. NPDC048832]
MGDHLPVPSPQMVRAARAHLARRYGRGVEALLWQAHEYPLPDIDAVRKAIAAIRADHGDTTAGGRAEETEAAEQEGGAGAAGQPAAVDGVDLGAALVVLQAARLDLDRLEVELVDAVREAGLDWAAIAAVLELPDAAAAQQRYEQLRPRLHAPVHHVAPPEPGDGPRGPRGARRNR